MTISGNGVACATSDCSLIKSRFFEKMEQEERPSPKAEADAAIAELRALVTTYDPIELVARVATYISSGNPDEPTDAGGPSKSEANLEYLLSIVTVNPFPAYSKFPTPEVIQRAVDLLTLIHFAVSHHLMTIRTGGTPAEETLGDIAASFQADKLHVRGDAYWPHLRRTAIDLLQPHDAKLLEILGFTSADYFAFMERTEAQLQARFHAEAELYIRPFMDRIRPWMHKDPAGNIMPRDAEAFAKFWAEHAAELDPAKERFDRVHGPEMYIFTAQTESEIRILASLSTALGENVEFLGRKPEHAFWPFTDSRTDRRPIIQHAGRHYLFHLTRPQREAYTIIGDLLRAADPAYWEKKFLKARDDYLEAETARLFQVALPGAQILTNAIYPLTGGDTAEADIVIICDDILLVVECKAARLDPATKRGADRKIVADLKATIAGGLNQAERFVRGLVSRKTMTVTGRKTNESLILDATRLRHLMRVNVTLELINVAAAQLWQLHTAGLSGDVERAWSVSLNDLRVIVDILDQPAVFLHYLLRRLDLNVIRQVHARDELDYLMHYVERGLFFRDANTPKADQEIRLVGFTKELDQYYRRIQGLTEKGDKPRVVLGPLTQPVIELLQTKRPPHWTTGCLALLEFDTSSREAVLAKRSGHLAVFENPTAAFAFSLTANFECRQGVVIASARYPASVASLLQARVATRTREYNLDEVVIIIGGMPRWESEVHVLIATTQTAADEKNAHLLSQLMIHGTQETKNPS